MGECVYRVLKKSPQLIMYNVLIKRDSAWSRPRGVPLQGRHMGFSVHIELTEWIFCIDGKNKFRILTKCREFSLYIITSTIVLYYIKNNNLFNIIV